MSDAPKLFAWKEKTGQQGGVDLFKYKLSRVKRGEKAYPPAATFDTQAEVVTEAGRRQVELVWLED